MKRTTLLLMMVGLFWEAAAQPNLDSLFAVWKDAQQPDSLRATAYYNYLWDGYLNSKPDTAYLLAEELIAFAEARDLPKAIAKAYNLQGTVHLVQSSYAKAITCYEKGIAILEASGVKKGMDALLGNLGLIYHKQGNYSKALDFYQKSLALNEELDDQNGMAAVLGQLGIIYGDQGDITKAMDHYQRSLAIHKEMGDRSGEADLLNNIGFVYGLLGDGDKELDHYQKSLAISEEFGDKYKAAVPLRNIGSMYSKNGKYPEALEYLQRSLVLTTEVGDRIGTAHALMELGTVHAKMGDHHETLNDCGQALTIAQEAQALGEQKIACRCLYNAYKAMGKGNEALQYLEQMRVIEDSLQGAETTKKLEQMEFARQMFADSVAKAEETRVIAEAHQEEIRKKNRTRNYLAVGGLVLLLVAGGLYSRSRFMRRSRDIISKERDRSDNLLLNILPAEIAAELKEKGRADARDFEMVSVLFTDFKGFTEASAKLSAQELVSEINTCFEAFDGIIGKHGIEKIKTIGDAYMAAGGLPVPTSDSVMNTVLAGLEMQAFIEARHTERTAQSLPAFRMRVGIHTGPVVAGIVGLKKFQYDIWGDTVNTASRMESSGEVGQVNISEATYRLVVGSPLTVVGLVDGSQTTDNRQRTTAPAFTFTPRGKVQAKGKGEMEMYFVL